MKHFCFLLLMVCLLNVTQAQKKPKAGLLFTVDSIYHRTGNAMLPFIKGCAPERVDLSDHLPPVGDQWPQNSCVAWALGYGARSYYNVVEAGGNSEPKSRGQEKALTVSPSFIYNLLNGGQNRGLNLQTALRLLMDTGACSLKSMPYEKFNWHKQPKPPQIEEAQDYRIQTYRKVDLRYGVINLKGELMAGNPVIAATYFDKKFYDFGYNTKEPFYVWDTMSSLTGKMGHAVVIVGYDDSLMAFKFMNSFGTNWGNEGFGWIRYNNVVNAIREAYIIKPNVPKTEDIDADGVPDYPDLPWPGPLGPRGPLTIDSNLTLDTIVETVPLPDSVITNILSQTDNGIYDSELSVSGLNVYAFSSTQQAGTTDSAANAAEIISTGIGLSLPEGLCHTYEVVIQLFNSENGHKGQPVYSANENYQLSNGQAAASTGEMEYSLDYTPGKDLTINMPLSALALPHTTTKNGQTEPATYELVVEPVLFIDGFPLRTGNSAPLTVHY